MSNPIAGFALRKNGTCEDSEVDCGRTVNPFRACCPGSAFCPTAWNVDCCPSSRNCTQSLLEKPRCANSSWDLYDNDGYFCCEKGTQGYAATTYSSGCAAPGYAFKEGERLLNLVSAGRESTSSSVAPTSSTPPASTSSGTSTQQTSSTESRPASETTSGSDSSQIKEPDSGKSSSTNVGAIAGGVVGGVLGLLLVAVVAWLLIKRRRKGGATSAARNQELDGAAISKHELDGSKVRNYELDGSGRPHVVYELPGNNTVHEAPG